MTYRIKQYLFVILSFLLILSSLPLYAITSKATEQTSEPQTLYSGETVDYVFEAVDSGLFSFCAKADTITGLRFCLISENNPVLYISVSELGELMYKRDDRWLEFTQPGIVSAEQWLDIRIDLPPDRNVNYANIYINDIFVGTALYDSPFDTIDCLRIESLADAVVMIDNIDSTGSTSTAQLPERAVSSPVLYVPEVIDSQAMLLINDSDPATGSMEYTTECAAVLDVNRTSFGVDLGTVQTINALRVTSSNTEEFDSDLQHYAVWISNDNRHWTQHPGFTYNSLTENSYRTALFEFSGVEARFVKINTLQTRAGEGTLTVSNVSTSIRAERRPLRQWKLAGTMMQALADTYPYTTPMTRVLSETPVMASMGDSIGINFGLNSPVEAIELIGADLSALAPDSLALFYSNDNENYTQIEQFTISKDIRNGSDVFRLTFPSLTCGYLKLHIADENTAIALTSLSDGIAAYSSVEAVSSQITYPDKRGAEGSFYTLENGSLIMGYNGFVGMGGDDDETTLCARTSTDGGYSWGEERIIGSKQPGSVNIMHPTFTWMNNGDLSLIYLEKESEEICNIYIRRSSDNGETWSQPHRITTAPQGYSILSSGNRFLRLSTGRLLLPVCYCPTVDDAWGADRVVAQVWFSDDDGYTWHRARGVVLLPNAALEPCLAELSDGSVLMSLRTRKEGKIYQALSYDGADTWTQPIEIGLDTPSATNSIVNIPSTNDLGLFWNHEFSDSNGERNPLTAAISSDGGNTYHNIKNLVEMNASIPWPYVEFYGRSVLFMYGLNTNLKIFDVSELYYTTSGTTTLSDLPKAETPNASYNPRTGWLTGVSADTLYSIDGGSSWVFAGGSSVLLERNHLDRQTGILVKTAGTHSTAPSDVQTITISSPLPMILGISAALFIAACAGYYYLISKKH